MAKLRDMVLYNYLCEVDRVIDGDTVDVNIDMGFYLHQLIRVRLLDVNTPERGEDDWKKATDTLKELLEQGEQVDKRFWLTTHKTGKYGRWLGNLLSYDKKIALNVLMAETWPATS